MNVAMKYDTSYFNFSITSVAFKIGFSITSINVLDIYFLSVCIYKVFFRQENILTLLIIVTTVYDIRYFVNQY
jgi:hypothetical protein